MLKFFLYTGFSTGPGRQTTNELMAGQFTSWKETLDRLAQLWDVDVPRDDGPPRLTKHEFEKKLETAFPHWLRTALEVNAHVATRGIEVLIPVGAEYRYVKVQITT